MSTAPTAQHGAVAGARFLGVRMQRPDEPGYRRADVHVIDDLR
jgi:hypothetical protein